MDLARDRAKVEAQVQLLASTLHHKTLGPDGEATGCNPVQVGSTPTGVSHLKGVTMKTALVRTFLDYRRQPLAAMAEIAKLVDELCRETPEFCAQVMSDATTRVSQKAHVLAGLLPPARGSAY